MAHWLEDAEKKISSTKEQKDELENRIENKKNEIKSNRIEIEDSYLEKIDLLKQYILRVNNLPKSERKPFDIIEYKQKENKLDNLLYKFSSSRRFMKREFSSLITPLKANHYKNTRSFFISIAREKGFVLLEYKEVTAKRIKREAETKSLFPLFSSKKRSKPSFEVTNKMIIAPLESLNDKNILKHLDWLAFKTDTDKFIKSIS